MSERGLCVEISNYGGTVVRLLTPDRHGTLADVVLGFDRVEDYVAHSPYFGALIGRCGNRIAGGKFSLAGRRYTLAANNTPGGIPCHLHGGPRGFDKVMWEPSLLHTTEGPALRLTYRSADGEEGYPGNLDVTVTYGLTASNTLRITYSAVTDQPTPVNLTNHSYFNLAGHDSGNVLAHAITLHASRYTPVNAGLIPLGEHAPVKDTPFDFRAPHTIGDRIGRTHEQLRFAGGYDHNFVLDAGTATAESKVVRATAARGKRVSATLAPAKPADSTALHPAAVAFEPKSGRVLEVFTTEPGVQFYSGNFLDGSFAGKGGCVYPRRGGFCLETQHFPDSPNQPDFPSVILRPGEVFRSTTEYRFSAR